MKSREELRFPGLQRGDRRWSKPWGFSRLLQQNPDGKKRNEEDGDHQHPRGWTEKQKHPGGERSVTKFKGERGLRRK